MSEKGKLNLRMPSELHAAIAESTKTTGTIINEFINPSMRSTQQPNYTQ